MSNEGNNISRNLKEDIQPNTKEILQNENESERRVRAKNQSDIENNKNQQQEMVEKEIIYGETPYRWFVLTAYSLCTFANQFVWITFSAIATDFSDNYEIPLWKVNMFSLIYMIIYPFVCIPEGWLIDNFSLRFGIIIASVLNIVGSGIRLFINKDSSLACIYIAQFLCGLFQPALLNSPGKLAANWFREDIRNVITTICCIAVMLGVFVGFLWNLAFIKENSSQKDFKDQVFNYMLSEFILSVVFSVPSFFIIKDKPDIPPSPSQDKDDQKAPGLVESLKILFTNIRFIYLLIATLFGVGYYDIMATIINSLLDLYTITGKQSSVIYAVSCIGGMISSLVISWLLDKYQKFKLFMIILGVLCIILQALFTLLLELVLTKGLNAYAIGLVIYTLIMMFNFPFYTIGMNYACEITYPVGESINGGIMMTMSQLAGIGGTFLCDYFISNYENKGWISNVILLGFFVISLIFILLFDEKLDRKEVEDAGRAKIQKNESSVTNKVTVHNNK